MAGFSAGAAKRRSSDLDRATGEIKSVLWIMATFSFVINLLMLASPLYMLQVYDRVLVSGRVETLIMLTLLVAAALLCLGLLDTDRKSVV